MSFPLVKPPGEIDGVVYQLRISGQRTFPELRVLEARLDDDALVRSLKRRYEPLLWRIWRFAMNRDAVVPASVLLEQIPFPNTYRALQEQSTVNEDSPLLAPVECMRLPNDSVSGVVARFWYHT